MTTNASKHGLRAAAAERSKKHSQRTPLPPRPGQVEAARQTVEELHEERIRAAQAKKLAARLAEEAVDLNLRNEKGGLVAVDSPDPRSHKKASAFAESAVAASWTAVITFRGDVTELTATRGPETIVQGWREGVWQYDASVYAFADRTLKPRNASGAARLLERDAATAEKETAKVASNQHFRKREPKDLVTIVLPLDPALLTDAEAAKYFGGRTVRWYNRWSRSAETATVSRQSPVRVTRHGDEVTISFCCPHTGFRAFHLGAVLAVGRGLAKTAEAGTVAVEIDQEDAA